jgi:nitrogenase molybdenum-iron protein alpha/beta subunit
VTVERAFGALKNRFCILDNKSFHTYKTQVKLVLACCIVHNWIIGFDINEVVLKGEGFIGSQTEADETQPVGDMLSQDSTSNV